jgi:NAD(P)-dependent dehydrogenase (short-subunit alcohol dehydrogenase family)
MLGLDADLEGDLGIDSIKRVEIAGTLTQSLALPGGAALDIERLTASRTLREVVDTLEAAAVDPPTAAAAQAPAEQRPFEDGPADEERIGRFVVQPASAPAIDASAGLADRGTVVIIDDGNGVGAAVAGELTGRRQPCLVLDLASVPDGPEQMAGLAEQLQEEHGGVNALVYLAASAGPAPLLLLVQALGEQLETAAADGGAAVLGVTRLGGTFGVEDSAPEDAAQGAIPGFLKTLAIEWPLVRVKTVDLSPAAPAELAAEQLVAELYSADDLVEVGYRDRTRTQLGLTPAPLDNRPEDEPITGDSVLVVTGGARGITAEAALSIASRYRPTLVLVGRTPLADEDPATAAIADTPDLRRALIETRRATGAELTPALVEEELRRLLRGRELRDNLSRLRATGARIEYLSCDVSDADAFAALIDEIYERFGRIDGVIHGAGVIEDRLVRDKRLDSLARVMQTKAGGALTLARKLRPEQLRFLVLFSSVSGRFGNRGQADYAAASEVLGRLAHELDRRWPARVVSMVWGPWRTSGMVSPELEREFARRGVALIPVEQGCRMLEEELRRGRKGEAEIVIGAATGLSTPAVRQPLLSEGEQIRKLDLERDRYLDHHRVDGRPVLPFAVAMELMAEAAALALPGSEVSGLREIRLLHGVTVDDDDSAAVRIVATAGEDGEMQVTIADPSSDRRHYSAVVELGASGVDDSDPPPPLDGLAPFPMGVDDAYRELLFHGPLFQGIGAIEGMDERGIATLLRPSRPGPCVAGAEGLDRLLDPVLLDSALQAQVIWARLQWDVTLLPAEIGSYRRVRPPASAAGELVRHEMRVRSGSRPPMCHADHLFRTADGRLLATLDDVVGVGTQALNRLAAARA